MWKGNQELVKTLNKSLLIGLLQRYGRLSRADIAETTSLSPSTVTVLADELLSGGLIQECGTAESSGGRKPRLLEINPQGGYIIGADLGGTAPQVGVLNLSGEVERRIEAEVPHEERSFSVDSLESMIREMQATVPQERLLGIGVAVPGLLNTETGTIVLSSLLQWQEVPLLAQLKERFDTRVCLINDASAAAFAESWRGPGRGVDHLLYVTAGRGVGSGMILGGSIYRGPRGMAGELGHMTVDLNGPLCRCGNRGCLGAIASGRHLARRAEAMIAAGRASLMAELVGGNLEAIGTRELVKAGELGDPLAIELLREAGEYIAAGIASLVNAITPEMVVVGGSMIHEGSVLLQTIQEVVPARVLPVHRGVPVVQTSLGEDGKLIGAATMVLEQVLKPVQLMG